MKTKRIVAVFTGNRAEYGLQYPILKALEAHPDLEYRLLVSGAHLQSDFGRTLDEIRADGIEIYSEVAIEMPADTLYATSHAIGSGVMNIAKVLDKLKPDLFVVYADRFEGFAAVIAGTQMRIPTAHIEGGDLTDGGALDDSVRHAMTKLSHLHFTTNEEAKGRVLGLGEEAWRVHNVGFPIIDLIKMGKYASPVELKERFGVDPSRPLVVFTQHSVTTEFDQAREQIRPSLMAMHELAKQGVQVLLTYPNNDAGGKAIIEELKDFVESKNPNIKLINSMGRYNYHGALALCGQTTGGPGVCVGNSSSGIKETPVFGCPTVNIGSRQNGRLRAENVIDVTYDATAIVEACKKALFDQAFRSTCKNVVNPYGRGDSGPRIAEILATVPIDQKLIQKKMTY